MTQRLAEWYFHSKDVKKKTYWEGEKGQRHGQQPKPWHDNPCMGGVSQAQRSSLRSEGTQPYIGKLSPGDLHQEESPHIVCL